MVDLLICAVSKKIRDAWSEYEVYTENVHQGVKKPCFFVQCEKTEKVDMLQRRFFVRVTVKIVFENDNDSALYDGECITARMFDLLSALEIDGQIFNGRKVYGKWEDGRLVVRCCYDVYTVNEKEDTALMESVEVKGIYNGTEDVLQE